MEELKKLESGQMMTHDVLNGQAVESTSETASRIRNWISELEPILAQYEKK